MNSNLRKYKDKILREMAEEEKREKNQSYRPQRRVNLKKIELFLLIIFSIFIFGVAEATNLLFSQQNVQDKLWELWNTLSHTTLHRKIIFSVQSALPEGHDFSWLANGITNMYQDLEKVIPFVAVWLWLLPYLIMSICSGLLITKISKTSVSMRELFTVSILVVIFNLFIYVNIFDLASVINFTEEKCINLFILFFVCYISIFIGSEIMVFIFKNMRKEYQPYE